MILNHPNLMCVGVLAPNEWNMNGNSGITYKVELSDGTGAITLPCADGDVWKVFEPFKAFAVSIDVNQVAREGRMGIRARIVNAVRAEK